MAIIFTFKLAYFCYQSIAKNVIFPPLQSIIQIKNKTPLKTFFSRLERHPFQWISYGRCCLSFGSTNADINVHPNLYEVNKSYFWSEFLSICLGCFLIKRYPATMSPGKHKYVPESVFQRHEREAFHICNATQIGTIRLFSSNFIENQSLLKRYLFGGVIFYRTT